MPQLQNLVLTDRATPAPVNHTFTPLVVNMTESGNVGVVVETSGVPLGEPKLTLSNRRASNKLRGKLVLTIPVVATETINGVSRPVVVREAIADVRLTFDVASTEAERDNAIGMLASAFATSKTLVNDTFVKGQGVY